MKNCPFSSENECDACNLFSEKENKCAIDFVCIGILRMM